MYNLNDKVQVKKGSGHRFSGLKGKVICFANNRECAIGVEFEKEINGGHDCGNIGKHNQCYYVNEVSLVSN